MKQRIARLFPLSALIFLLASPALFAAKDGSKPNFLFIFADDQCYETLGSAGNAEIHTPQLDALAKRSLAFTHAYNQGSWSGAVCVASRTMLNTGRFIWRADAVYATSEQERQAGRFWSEHLKQAGYETYFTGKWHVRANANMAFNHAAHVRGGMPRQTPAGYNRPFKGKPDAWSPYDKKFGGFWEGGKHWSEVVGDDATDFLQQAARRDKPFFMYVAFNAPHDPRQSPKEYVDMYPLDKISLPENFIPEYPYKDGIGCSKNLRDERLAPFPRTPYAVKTHRQEYYAIISHMDAQIGRILKALKDSGKQQNTYVFFTADHGLAVGHHGLIGKQNLYDHSVRVPFLAAGPGIMAGKNAEPIYLQDVMPTTLELAGVKKPAHVEFHSLTPMFDGQSKSPYDAIYGAYLSVQRSIQMDGFKLLMYPAVKKWRLYNVADDPQEMNDLVNDSGQLQTARKLFGRFLKLQVEMGDKLDVAKHYPELR